MLYCLPVETKVRDLDARLLLAVKLVQRGHECVVGAKFGVYSHMFARPRPYVFVAKSATRNPYTHKLHGRIRASGGRIVVLDEEGGVYIKDTAKIVALRADESILQHVERYFAWGERQREILSASPELQAVADRIMVSGHPRFDLCAPRWATYHRVVDPASCRYRAGYFLVNTNFATTNHQLGYKEERRYSEQFAGTDVYSDESWDLEERYERAVMKHFIDAIRELAQRFPERDIIIRPHPVENLDTYKDIFREQTNVHAVREGSVQEWIVNAAVVLHHDCTTGIEAMLSGRPTISYCPILDEELAQWLPVAAGFRITHLEELLGTIEEHVVRRDDPAHFSARYDLALIKEFIANTDFSAADLIVDALCEHSAAWEQVCREQIAASGGSGFETGVALRARRRLGRWLLPLREGLATLRGGQDNLRRLKRSKFGRLTTAEVRLRVAALLQVEPGPVAVEVRPAGYHAYLIRGTRLAN